MKHISVGARVTTEVFEEEGDLWYIHSDGGRRKYKSRHMTNKGRMYVDGKYIPQTHPLYKAGRYKSFNHAAFSSFENYNKSSEGDVYVITNKAWPEWIKVGKAVTAKDRLKSYQTSDPFRAYELHCKFVVRDRHIFELQAHQLLKAEASDFKNEWFKINPATAQQLLATAVSCIEATHEAI